MHCPGGANQRIEGALLRNRVSFPIEGPLKLDDVVAGVRLDNW